MNRLVSLTAMPADSVYETPRYQRWLASFALAVTLLLAGLAGLAWWIEGATLVLITLPLWVCMAGYWFGQGWLWAQQFRLAPDRLLVVRFGRVLHEVPYRAVHGLHYERGRLHLVTAQQQLSLRGEPNTLAQVAAALAVHIPTLAATAPLLGAPIHVNAPRQPVLLMSGFGLLIGALGIGLGNAALGDPEFPNRIGALLFALLMITIGGTLLYWLLFTFVWSYHFAAHQIRVRQTLRTTVYAPANLQRIDLHAQAVTTRGFTKILYTLHLTFRQGQPLIVQPGAQNYPFDYADIEEQVTLTRLHHQLEQLYTMHLMPVPAVTTRMLDPHSDLPSLPGAPQHPPDYIIEHHAPAADLRVLVINYGERQPGAEELFLWLSRPVAGYQCIATTNGDAEFSPHGTYLLLRSPFLLVVIETQTLAARHYRLPDRTMLLSTDWEGERLVVRLVGYSQPSAAATTLGPFTWADLSAHWQPGLGQAPAFQPQEASR